MHTRIVSFKPERSEVLNRFPNLNQRKAELEKRAQGATLAALTALEHTYTNFPDSRIAMEPGFEYLERIGFRLEKIDATEVLCLRGENLFSRDGEIYTEETAALSSLLEFRGLFEKNLRATLQEIWELWNVSPVGYHMIDREGVIQTVNETEARILGYKPEEMVDRSIFDFILPSQRKEARRRFVDKLEGREVPPTQDRIYLHRDGTEVNMSAEDLLVKNDAGQVIGVKTVLIDISKMRRLQEQLYQLQKKEDLGELAKGVAHEFNNIVCAIQLAVQTLRKLFAQDAEDALALCDTILESCAKSKAITDSVLYYARLKNFHPEIINPEVIAQNILRIFANQSQPPIDYRFKNGSKYSIYGGEHQVYQAIMNLVTNAVDAMPRGGILSLELNDLNIPTDRRATCGLLLRKGKYLAVRVSDNGSGIPEELISKLFDPFFTTKSPATSTGLGLSTVLGIMESHNGGIDVKSRSGEGTEFTLYFPAISSV